MALRPVELAPGIVSSKNVYLFICARGLELEAEILVSQKLVDCNLYLQHLTKQEEESSVTPAASKAVVGQFLVGVDKVLPLLPGGACGIPGIIHVYALVAIGCELPESSGLALSALRQWSAGLSQDLCVARRLVAASVVESVPTFRVSLFKDPCHDFSSMDAMIAFASSAGATVDWRADLKNFDIEVMVIINSSSVIVGLSCAPLDALGSNRLGATHSAKLPQERAAWVVAGVELGRLRHSTAALLLECAKLAKDEKVLDCCGGVGTIAIEAASRIEGVQAFSLDSCEKACKMAEKNASMARQLGMLASDSFVHVLHGKAQKCDERLTSCSDGKIVHLGETCVDAIVAELPFDGKFGKPISFSELLPAFARIMRVSTGRVVLLMPSLTKADLESSMLACGHDVWRHVESRTASFGSRQDAQIMILLRGNARAPERPAAASKAKIHSCAEKTQRARAMAKGQWGRMLKAHDAIFENHPFSVLPLPVACVAYDAGFLTPNQSHYYFEKLNGDQICWATNASQAQRSTAVHGEDWTLEHHVYDKGYAADKVNAWTPELLEIRDLAQTWYHSRTGKSLAFDWCLLNRYSTAEERLGWHADREEIDPKVGAPRSSPIVSISLGCERKFAFRLKADHKWVYSLHLASGSAIVMENVCQFLYEHTLLAGTNDCNAGTRINLTFRCKRCTLPTQIVSNDEVKSLPGPSIFVGHSLSADDIPHGFKEELLHPFESPFINDSPDVAASRYWTWINEQPLFLRWLRHQLQGHILQIGDSNFDRAHKKCLLALLVLSER